MSSDALTVPEPVAASPTPPRRTWLRAFLWSALAVALLTLGSFAGCMVAGSRAQVEGEAFVRDFAPRAMQPWRAAAFSKAAGPQLLAGMAPGQFEKLIRFFAGRLGPLKTVRSVQNGPFNVSAGTQGFQVRTSHEMSGEFEKGPAMVHWLLLRQDGKWKVEGVRVNSDLLLE